MQPYWPGPFPDYRRVFPGFACSFRRLPVTDLTRATFQHRLNGVLVNAWLSRTRQIANLSSSNRQPAFAFKDVCRSGRSDPVAMHSLWDISPKMRPNAEKRPKYGPTTAAFGAHRSQSAIRFNWLRCWDCHTQRDAARR